MARINLRQTHPSLFWIAIIFAVGSIALGLNFLFLKPTFNPYGINVLIIGAIFLFLGIQKLVALLFVKNLTFIRVSMALCSVYMIFWGAGSSITVFQGKTSAQLPIALIMLAIIQWRLLREPYVNPLTSTSDGDAA